MGGPWQVPGPPAVIDCRAPPLLPVGRRAGVAFLALKRASDHRRAAFRRDDPRTINPWRIVARVLEVAAVKLGHPVTLRVLVKTDDLTFHAVQGEQRQCG